MRKTISLLVAPLFLTLSFSSLAETKSDSKSSFDFKPVVIDSKNGTGSTVGIEYEFKGEQKKSLNSNDAGIGLNPDATIGEAVLGYSAKGTVAASKDRNPKNFLEFQLDGKFRYSASGKGSMLGGLFAKYESNQSFTSKQSVYGLGGTYGKMGVLGSNDFVAFNANYGRVDPKDDTARQAALGAAPLNPYNRWNLEFLYMLPVQSPSITAFEFNYRYFLENNAPAAIKAAEIDKHQLATVRLGLKNDLFLAYSTGKLPFDKKNDQMLQIGFSYKLF